MAPLDSQGNNMRKSVVTNSFFLLGIAALTLGPAPTDCLGQTPANNNELIDNSNQESNSIAPQKLEWKSRVCVPGMPDYPAFQNTYGNPYRIMDCRNGECESTVMNRWKRSMQASHWGYPEYFHKNSYGYANRNAFANNIRDGAIERSTLYLLDFYPENSPYAHLLTPKGLERLEKSICVGATLGSALRVEKSARPELDELRLQWLAEHPWVVAAGLDSNSIQLVSKPVGIQASEAIYRYQRGIAAPTNAGSGGASNINSGATNTPPMLQGMGTSTGNQNLR
jgi:hypothetical protein